MEGRVVFVATVLLLIGLGCEGIWAEFYVLSSLYGGFMLVFKEGEVIKCIRYDGTGY